MDTNRLDLNLLVVFDAILRERSVGGAARSLHLSQPAVSGALARLRDALNDQLFIRTRRGMVPTRRALELEPTVSSALSSLRDALRAGQEFDPATSERTFTVLMSEVGQLLFLPPVSQFIRRVAPGIRLVAIQSHPSHHLESMEKGELDLAVGVWPYLKQGVLQQSLFKDGWMCVAREDHPAVGKDFSLEDYLSLEHVTVTSVSGGDGIIAKSLQKQQNRSRRIALQVTDFLAAPLIVAKTDLIATAPETLAQFYSDVARLKMVDVPFNLPTIDLRVYWHRRSETDAGITWLRNAILDLLNEYNLRSTRHLLLP
ncbi:LysR family transcriptional regulator [Vannielia litorea]|uniref:LysR family transcriptional regulator n=1 Tax=Vannielia litorea TaxID=1217970 RepID=UPI001BCF0E57|nr:LysR family transcriptional regulator [Vannielia litorea]MBS8224668.1 LysR family transcriptional regulator [Vannielia litorea]